jgi:uncharacterized repeat protein (TIGR03803 family)
MNSESTSLTVDDAATPNRITSTPLFAAVVALAILAVSSAQGQSYKEKVLYQFSATSDGGNPYAGLIADAKGNLYGTTTLGGTGTGCNGSSCGTVFEVTRARKESVLYSFQGTPKKDGAFPYAALLPDGAGNFYGTTHQGGGKVNAGTVFKLSQAGKETVLYRFHGVSDGGQPCSGLLSDKLGNLYGIADSGGAFGFGVVFKVTKTGKETVLYSFTQKSFPGLLPCGTPIADAQGNLYDTTYFGGTSNLGTIFKLTKAGKATILYSFTGPGGAFPVAGLFSDTKGNIYGTTSAGGDLQKCGTGCGVVFKANGGKLGLLHIFGGPDGEIPYGVLIGDAKGNLYGTTTLGGKAGFGTVFTVTQAGKETVLHNFTGGSDGASPWAGLLSDAKGDLFGTTEAGGFADAGTVFKLTP